MDISFFAYEPLEVVNYHEFTRGAQVDILNLFSLGRPATTLGALRRMFGIGERALTRREEDTFTRWLAEYNYSPDVIGIAYDITVNTSGKASVAYADKILVKWYTAGCRSEAEVEAFIEREKQSFTSKTPLKKDEKKTPAGIGSFDTDEFFQRALERSYGPKGDK